MTDFGRRPGVAAENMLLKTDQVTSYRDGDDGFYQKGWDDGDRFTDNEDGTVTDNATGLMWPKDWAGVGGNLTLEHTWENAIDWANALDFAGHDDWRLPNIHELYVLCQHEYPAPGQPNIFDNVPTGDYWSSTTAISSTAFKLSTDFNVGIINENIYIFEYHVVAVRDA